ncbi:hypothetical protein B0J15DRAFT_516021 [Fusarium solani]|uniref:Nephrocystin 3-like N-terminal domain-containing protein n=1 Tax=Fusarium solani TaxID=169388 RepID=A0A9P9GKA6_FUSSL|nr:uncharacterized protein B0J15DRAFT_516021 [Fusarium solani]KAH7240501.1 hypothetical protein B0J15DRAFT_516021 [Fusarium solani]
MDSSHSKIVLDRLPTAAGAAHDSSDSWLQATCLENTRVDVLREIYEWASDSDSNSTTLFWLNGMAGTGKSTISRTVAQRLAEEGSLGGSFFFKKGETDRANPSKLFTTLAAGLSRWQSVMSQYIREAIDQNPQIFDQMPHQHFSKLILEPLSQASLCSGKPVVFVIDALDECQHHSITSIITDILPRARSLRHPRLTFFLTSRPELPIQAGFPKVERRNTYQDMILQDVPRDIIQKDLETFLRGTIEQIRIRYNDGSGRLPPSWPGKYAIQRIVNMATPLFIVASTVCLFLEDRRLGNPRRQMDKILAVKDRTHSSMLDQMYLAVLSQQFEGGPESYTPQQKSQIVDEFRLIVGSIILLSTPLTIPVLAHLLHGEQDVSDFQETLENRLELLHSVLSVPPPSERLDSPVRALHFSFRDFLLDGERRDVNPFWVDEAKAHLVLAESCLRVMRTSLREDICELSDPGTQKTWIMREIVNDCLPPHVQYACLHWIDHLEQAHIDSVTGKAILEFLEMHLLHWLEALSFLNRVLESVVMVERLNSATQDAGLPRLFELLSDLVRFTGANARAIDLTPLQVYSSALVFAPLKSRTGVTVLDKENGVAIWEGVNSVTFSTDSALLIVVSFAQIQVWRVVTGDCVYHLCHPQSNVTSMSLLTPGLIASGSSMGGIRIWELETGRLVSKLEGHRRPVRALAVSADEKLLASGSDGGTMMIWQRDNWIRDIQTGTQLLALEQPMKGNDLYEAVFSLSSELIATGYLGTIQIWQVATRKCIRTLNTFTQGYISLLVFSSDSTVVGADQGGIINVWDISTGRHVRTIPSNDGVVSIWQVSTGNLLASWDTGVPSSRLSFENGDTQLLTNSGLIGINLARVVEHETMSAESTFSANPVDLSPVLSKEENFALFPVFEAKTGIGIDNSRKWITWNGQPFILIPVEYSEQDAEVHDSSVLLKPIAGRPMVITFNYQMLTNLSPY